MFTGIGGIDAGIEACGLSVRWQCESDPFRRGVLRRHWPGIEIHPDARTLDPEPVDVLAGGSPCQDLAAHGGADGLDGRRSGLWHAFVRAIATSRAQVVFFENVANILRKRDGRDFATVLETLAGMGFDARWGVFRANEAGLPHRRRRLFLLAYTGEGRRILDRSAHDDDGRQPFRDDVDGRDAALPPPPGPGDVAALQAWTAIDGRPLPGVRRDLAGLPDRVDRIAALGDTAPSRLVALAWRTLRDGVCHAPGA